LQATRPLSDLVAVYGPVLQTCRCRLKVQVPGVGTCVGTKYQAEVQTRSQGPNSGRPTSATTSSAVSIMMSKSANGWEGEKLLPIRLSTLELVKSVLDTTQQVSPSYGAKSCPSWQVLRSLARMLGHHTIPLATNTGCWQKVFGPSEPSRRPSPCGVSRPPGGCEASSGPPPV
jgi:hypothetical protein